MSLKRDEYWWIENKRGHLVTVGRKISIPPTSLVGIRPSLVDYGIPRPTLRRHELKGLCREGERPVKVKIVKVTK